MNHCYPGRNGPIMRWANFLAMRRTHATLMNELGVNGKLVGDQLGHRLDVSQNV
jgi:integrase